MFSAGLTSVLFDIPIHKDMEREKFCLLIVKRSLPPGLTKANPSRATVTINW